MVLVIPVTTLVCNQKQHDPVMNQGSGWLRSFIATVFKMEVDRVLAFLYIVSKLQ